MILEESLVGSPLVQIVWQRLQLSRYCSFQSEVADDAPADVAVERLVERGPAMFMDQMGTIGTQDGALEDSVQQAEQSGLSADGACRLRDILSRRVDAFACVAG